MKPATSTASRQAPPRNPRHAVPVAAGAAVVVVERSCAAENATSAARMPYLPESFEFLSPQHSPGTGRRAGPKVPARQGPHTVHKRQPSVADVSRELGLFDRGSAPDSPVVSGGREVARW